ncbi:MAG TPA: efflux transporter periplasmic adaptor subunit [Cyanothece sp. UBA12306]|nr:efflux transporter periplasmic adaptor subunit [Cyanothece sp. UBA12306]
MQIPLITKINQNRYLTWILGAIVLGLVGTAPTIHLITKKSGSLPDISEMTVPVEAKTLTQEIKTSGVVRPTQSVNLSPKTAGQLAELYVEKGQRVKKGQMIARMEDNSITTQVLEAKANLRQVQARLAELLAGNPPEEIDQAQARLNKAKSNLDELKTGTRSEEIAQVKAQLQGALAKEQLLSKRSLRYEQLINEGAIAQDQLDETIAEYHGAIAARQEVEHHLAQLQNGSRSEEIAMGEAEVAEAQAALDQLKKGSRPELIAQVQAEVAAAQAKLDNVQTQVKDTIITAPFSGLITQRYSSPGAFVTPTTSASSSVSATSTSIVALAQGLEVLAELSEVDISKIKIGQPAEIRSDAYPQKVFRGRVQLIAPEAVQNNNVTSFQVQIALETGQNELLSGMNVRLTIVGKKIPQSLVVPNVAILTQNGETGVLIPNQKNQPVFQPVSIGSMVGDQTQILQGVQEGELVFIDYPAP